MKENKTPIKDVFLEHKEVLAAYMARFFLRREDVEDILQETFVRTLEASRQKEIISPKDYLFITARNLIFRHVKQQSRQVHSEITTLDSETIAAPVVSADNQLHHRNKMQAFIETVDTLPKQCRRVFLMRKVYGMSQKEIAKELNISPSTVERHITNALHRCRQHMGHKGYTVYGQDATVDFGAAKGKK